MKKHVPNFITSLNLVSGFIAIIFACSGNIITASWLILAAMVFDFLDGFSARLLKSYSRFGKELDSLADVVSFGTAPAFIIYRIIYHQASSDVPDLSEPVNLLMILIISFMPVCAALRLAKFNLDESQSTGFMGLPTPANAIAVISIVIADHYSGKTGYITDSSTILLVLTILLSLLMVSRLPLLSLKTKSLKMKGNEGRYLMIAFIGVSFIIIGISAALLIIPIYIIASLLSPYLTAKDSKA